MGSLFRPKMPPLPPVQPLPEPPKAELSQEEKDRIAAEQREIERKRKGRRSTILTGPLGVEEEAETEQNLNSGLTPAGEATDGHEIQLTLDDMATSSSDSNSFQSTVTDLSTENAPMISGDNALVKEAEKYGYEGDPCPECGQFTLVSNGRCLKCVSCGATTGCS